MALLFSAVTVTAGYDEAEFTVGGIPREYDDLVGFRFLCRERYRHSRGGRISDDAHGTG